MGLKDLTPDKNDDGDNDWGDFAPRDSSKDTNNTRGDNNNKEDGGGVESRDDDISISVDPSSYKRADMEPKEKVCKYCGCISPKVEKEHTSPDFTYESYECPNPECGALEFRFGRNECKTDNKFLGTVEYGGWRYNGDNQS